MNMFKPNIKIIISPSLKTYSLEITVLVPSGCYLNAGATTGVPAGHFILPESEPVTLNIVRHDGLCTQALQTLTFKIAWLPLTIGKNSVVAFVVVNGEVVSVGSKPIIQFQKNVKALNTTSSPITSSGVILRSISGWINAMPPGPANIILIVNVFAPCINYDYKFTNLGPFGFTGRTLLVKFEASLPDACQKAIFEGPKRFEQKIDDVNQFDSIAVEFEGNLYLDPLEIVQ